MSKTEKTKQYKNKSAGRLRIAGPVTGKMYNVAAGETFDLAVADASALGGLMGTYLEDAGGNAASRRATVKANDTPDAKE